jgi:carbon-monoxide dehydrogenase large subunit
MRLVNTYIGAAVERIEDQRFLTGTGCYIGDLNKPGQWHAVVLRSPIGHGQITKLDVSAALKVPGVKAVLTANDLPNPVPTIPFRRPIPSIVPFAQPVMAKDRVRYVGEPVAMVLAESQEIAEDALAFIELEIEQLLAVTTCRQSKEGKVKLFDAAESNVAAIFHGTKGDVDMAFEGAAVVVREQLSTQRQTALPMETRGLVAEWDEAEGRLTVSGAAKLPFFNRRSMATVMGLEETKVDYIEYDVGGGFGARGEFYPEDFLTAFAARHYKRPVKWVEDRREHLMAIGHSRESECDLEVAFDKEGRILGVRGDILTNIGAYMRPNGTTPVRNAAQFLTGQYKIPSFRLHSYALVGNKTPAGTYRGPGRYEGCFFFERIMDIAARKLGIDRLDIRRRNFIPAEELPYLLDTIQPNEGWNETYYDSGDYLATFESALAEAGWADKAKLSGKLVDGRYHGLGVACFIEGGASGPRENARMLLLPGGKVRLIVGSSSIGQGVETIMVQIAADALEISMDKIEILHGSTNLIWEGFGSYGSRATVMGGCAVIEAAKALLDKLAEFAAAKLGVAKDQIVVSEGVARAPDGRIVTLADAGGEGFDVRGTFSNNRPTFSYGAGVAHVAVDAGTGHVEVLGYTVVDDVGRVINPETLHGQVVGAAVQGFGAVFGENLVYDENAQLLVGSLADYQIPLATDYPHIHAVSTGNHPSPFNPLGAKGAGEGGIIPLGGAVVNAIADALQSFGVEPRVLPVTPPALWRLIDAAKVK